VVLQLAHCSSTAGRSLQVPNKHLQHITQTGKAGIATVIIPSTAAAASGACNRRAVPSRSCVRETGTKQLRQPVQRSILHHDHNATSTPFSAGCKWWWCLGFPTELICHRTWPSAAPAATNRASALISAWHLPLPMLPMWPMLKWGAFNT
jgi:hypothetical protein